jgi:DNA-binding LacI/PurR family transcriptional regulator
LTKEPYLCYHGYGTGSIPIETERRVATIRDVAKKAGVGVGTVSRVLNNSQQVSDATRQRVLAVIEELDYAPSAVARRLSLGKALTIAVIVPFFTRPGFSERLNGVVNGLSRSEYDLLIHNIETAEQRAGLFRTHPRREYVDGALVLSLHPYDHEVSHLRRAGVPIVLIDSEHPSLGSFHQVRTDDVRGGRLATEHLLALGHTRIGFVGDVIDNAFNFISSRDRYQGYRQALAAHDLPLRLEYYAEGQHGREEARTLARTMLSLPEPPTAVFAASDTQAVGVLQAARDLGRRVPDELSVVGYDDIELAEIMGLTTVCQQLFESGQRGVELLLAKLEDPEMNPVHETLPIELVPRRSTAPARTSSSTD